MTNLWTYLLQSLIAIAILTALGAALGGAVRQRDESRH